MVCNSQLYRLSVSDFCQEEIHPNGKVIGQYDASAKGEHPIHVELPLSRKPSHCRTTTVRQSDPESQMSSSSSTGKKTKEPNAYLRWNLLFTFVILVFLTLPIWISLIPRVQNYSLDLLIIILIILNLFWFVGAVNAIRYTVKLRRYTKHNIDLSQAKHPEGKKLKHLVGVCIYKEPLDLMIETIDSVVRQPGAKEKISVVIGLEEGTPEKEEKARTLRQRYEPLFERFFVTFHPKNLPGEIPGKCSNLNYAMREAVYYLKQDKGYGMLDGNVEVLVTTGDCDSIFGLKYFDALEEDYYNISEEKRRSTVWQSPLFYTMRSGTSPFFVRVTGLIRSFFMIGFLIPLNINTMSIFSLTLDLLEKGEYTHPGYQMEDIIAVIRWSLAIRKRCTIRCIPVATMSGPTSGNSYCNELYEWARQIRRWTIGAAEVFHYFVIKSTRLPFAAAVSFSVIFIFYYGFMLCVSSLFGLIAPIIVPILLNADNQPVSSLIIPDRRTFTFISLGFLGLQYFWFFLVFLVHRLCEKAFPDGRRDEIGLFHNIFHFILSFPTIIMYSCVELFAFLEVTVRGKAVCSHGASKKDNLRVVTGHDNGSFVV